MGAHVKSRSHSMLKIGSRGLTVDHGIPRQRQPLRMCTLSLGLLFLFISFIPGVRACSPCISSCNCALVDTNSTKCAVDCSNKNLKSISRYDLPDSSKWMIVQLNLSRNRIKPDANFFDHLVHLEKLDLSYNGITSLDSTTFTRLTDLKALNLSGNELQVINDKSFEIPELKTLDLSGNPVSSFGLYTFTSSSSITALYINNLKLKSLPAYMFRNLKKLQVLYAQGNQINYIDKDAFSKNNDLTTLDVSNNFLTTIESDTFEDLTALTYLDVSHNNLTFIDTSLFKDLTTALTSLNIAFNPWKCDCTLKPFRDYLVRFMSSNRQLLNQQNTSCSSSPEKSFLDAGEDKFWCAASYFSCYSDEEEETQTTIGFSLKFTKSTELECAEICFENKLVYATLSSTTCLCGSLSAYDCSCTGHSYVEGNTKSCTGSSSSLTFTSNVFKVSTGLTFEPISKKIAGTSQNYVAKVNLTNINQYQWSFGDSSDSVTKGATSTSYSINYTYPVPGKFTLKVKVCVSSTSACEEGSVTVIVEPPSSLIKVTLTGDKYANTTAKANVAAAIPVGQGVEIEWTRSPSDGYTATTGAGCDASSDVFRGRCLSKGSTTKTYDDATTACANDSLVTHLHSNEEIQELAALYSSVANILLEAKKSGIFYKWKDGSYAYFDTGDVTDSSNGDCVVLDTATSSLKGVDCASAHGYACQSAPTSECPYGGSLLASNSNCYVLKSSALSWTDASTACQSITTNARLAVVNSASIQSHLTSNVITAKAWVGLSDSQLEGYPMWVNDESLTTYNPLSWVPIPDCFTLDASGTWAGHSCRTTLPHVCEYSIIREKVDVRTYLAGTAALNPTDNTYTLETLTSTTFTTNDLIIATVFPGHWFPYTGTLLSWNFRVAALANEQKLTLQVFRPECNSGETLLTPECNGYGARFASCKTSSASCTSSSSCDEGKQWCYLDNSCKPVSDPCNCNTVHASKCSTFYEGSQPKYVAIGGTSVVLPQSSEEKYYTLEAGDIDVQENDVLGFSVDSGTNVIVCDNGAGNWAQNGHQSSLLGWIPTNNAFNPDDWKNNTSCYVQAIYAPSETKSAPDHMSYFTAPDTYQYQLNVIDPAETKSFSVEVQEEIGTITWLYPALQASGLLYLEQGLPELMVVRISAGSNAQVNWTVVPTTSSAPTVYTTDLQASCPSGNYQGLYDSCITYLNWPSKPFGYTSHAYSIGIEGTLPGLEVKVFNQISSQTKSISLKLFIPIGGVSLTLKIPNSNNYVEYNADSVLVTSLISGSPTLYTYYVNNTEVYSGFSNELTYNFSAFAAYKVKVNASDDLNWVLAEITVTAKVKANLANLTVVKSESVLIVNQAYGFGITVDVTEGALVKIKWDFGASSQEIQTTTTSNVLLSSLNYTYSVTSSYTLTITVTDEFDDSLEQTIAIEVVEEITSVSLTATPAIVATGNALVFTAILPTVTGSYGTVYYTYDFKDGNSAVNQTGNTTSHTYNAVSVYTAEVTATNGASTQSATVQVTAEDAITDLALSGTTPVLLYTDTTYTATKTKGSNVAYVFSESTLGVTSTSSSSNQYNFNFTSVGVFSVQVTATNLVGSDTATLEVYAVEDSTLEIHSLTHDQFASKDVSLPVVARVLHTTPSSLTFTWDFGDGSSVVKQTGLLSTSHTYTTVGTYNITLLVEALADSKYTTSYTEVQVQEIITGLSLTSSGNGKIESGVSASVTLTASITTGTSLNYTWTYDSVSYSSDSATYTLVYDTPGTVDVKVVGSNQVSSDEANVSVIVQHAVEGLTISCLNCIEDGGSYYLQTNSIASLVANVTAGTDITYSFLLAPGVTVTGAVQSYNYSTPGAQVIQVTVSNVVSSVTASFTINVQDPISDFSITSAANSQLVNVSITVTTSVSGTDPRYRWKWCSTCAEFDSNSGSSNPVYSTFGYYTVTVIAYNAINRASATKTLSIHDPITVIYLTSPNLIMESNTRYIGTGETANLTATADNTRFVYYTWKITNPFSISQSYSNQQSVGYQFPVQGQYIVKIDAYNTPSTFTDYFAIVAVAAISNVKITGNSSSPLATGSGLQLTAGVDTGTVLSYKWILDSQIQAETSNTFVLSFPASGTYLIQLNISNPIGEDSSTKEYKILDVVDGISIVSPSNAAYFPFVANFQSYLFTSNVTKGDDWTVEWELYDTGLQASSTGLTYTKFFFTSTNYTLYMKVKNDISSKTTSIVFSVQSKLNSLKLVSSTTVAKTGDTINFEADHNIDANYLTYEWTIESVMSTTTTKTKSHIFNTPGTYTVHLRVYNKISGFNATEDITIQDLIQDLNITGCDAVVNVTSLSQALATLTKGTDVEYVWTTTLVDGSVISQTSSTFAYAFQETAVYTISLNATNLVDTKHLQCQYTVIGIISNVVLNSSSSIFFVNYTVVFFVTGDNLVGVTYEFSISPSGENSTSTLGVLTKDFTTPGTYTITMRVYHSLNSVTKSETFYIDQLQCDVHVLTAGGNLNRQITKSQSAIFEAEVDRNGCTVYDLEYKWRIYPVLSCSDDLVNAENLDNLATDRPTLMLNNGTLSYGNYCVMLATEYKGTPLIQNVSYTLEVKKSSLVAVISGGSSRTMPKKEMKVDGSMSFDPDYSSSLQYSWACSASGVGPGSACSAFTGSNSQSVTLTSAQLTSGEIYVVTLTVSATGRMSGSYSQKIIVSSPDIPIVSIECRTCTATNKYRFNTDQQLKLTGKCENCQSATSVAYTWSLTYDNSGTPVPFNLDSSNTNTGTAKNNLVVNANVLTAGKIYTFTLNIDKTVNTSVTTSSSEIVLQTNMGLTPGTCTASTAVNFVALKNLVSVSCSGFTDPDGVSTELYYKVVAYSTDTASDGDSVIIYYGTRSSLEAYIAPWPGSSRTTVKLKVFVSDEDGATVEGLSQNITFTEPTLASSVTKSVYLQSQADGDMIGLVKQNSPILLLQYVIAMIQELNEESRKAGVNDTEQAYRATLRNILTLTGVGLPMENIPEQQQMAFFMKQLTQYPTEYQNSNCQNLVLGEAQSIKTFVDSLAVQGMDPSVFLPESLLETVSNTMSAVNIAAYSTSTPTLGYFNSSMQKYIPSISSLTDVFSSSSLSEEDHRKVVVTSAFKLAEDIVAVNLKLQVVGEAGVELRLENKMRIYGIRAYADELNKDYITNSSSVTVQDKLLEGIADGQEVFQIYLVINQNPYTWNLYQGQSVSTKLVSLSITDTAGSGYTISGLTSDKSIKMILAEASQELTLVNGSLIGAVEYNPQKNIKTSDITVKEGSPKIVNLDTSSGFEGASLYVQVTFSVLTSNAPSGTSPAVGLKVYLGKDIDKPEPCAFTETLELTENTMLSGVDHRQYTFHVSDFSTSSKYKVSLFNNDTNYPVNATVGIYFTSCQYYDKTTGIWASDGTQSLDESIPIAAVCSATHLTAFSASMLVPPDAISFDDLTFLEVLSNPVVFITCAIVLAVYVVAVIICRRMDIADIDRISSVPLCGKDGSFKYEVTVVTGRQRGAGTTAHVGIKLYGDYGKSKPRHLSKKGAFQRNCQDSFNIAHDTNLGNINKILIWHDNHGMDPSWYLVQVIVRDLQTDQKYYFFVNCWFSLEMEHGFIQKDIKAADSSEIKRFGRIFTHAVSTSMADRHLWVSVFDRPAQSRFTRVQRVTCIVTILYTFMCANVIWYGMIKQKDTSSDQGVSSFGWEEVVVALVTNATVLPISLILISIFKKSRSKSNVFEQGNRSSTARTIEIENACDNSDYNSFRTNDDLLSYLDRESTTESMATTTAEEPVGPVGLRRTKTLKTSHHPNIPPPSTADSTASSSKDRPNQLRRTNNPGLWKKDSLFENWQNRLPGNTTDARPDTDPHSKEAAHQAAKEAADEIMQYLDDVETEFVQKEAKKVKTVGGAAKPSGTILRKPTLVKRTSTRDSNPPDSSSSERKGGLSKRMSTLSVASSKASTSQSRRQFTPREEPAIPERKPASAGSVNKWASKLKTTVSTDSIAGTKQTSMPEVEHIGPLEPDLMLSRQQSHPDIVNRGMHSFSMDNGSHRRAKKCTLPTWCVYLGYVLCFTLSVVSIIIVMLYGYQFGSDVALQWVLALIFSMAMSFILFEPLKALSIALWLSAVEKKPNPYEEDDIIDIEPAIDNSVEHIKETKFKPLAGFALLNAKEDGQKIQRMRLMLRQFVAYIFYLWLLMVLCYVNISTMTYTFSSGAETLFIKTTLPDSNHSVENLTSIEDFWNWTQTVLADGLHGSELNTDEEFGYLLGVARLRQVRSETEVCIAASTASSWGASSLTDGKTCVGSDGYTEDEKSYAEYWNINQSQNLSWRYNTASETGSKWRRGNVYSYGGGGYVQPLGTSYNESTNILQDLQTKEWITLRTRAVFIDFTLYNPATDLTTVVNIMLEFPLTGSVNTTYEIQTQKLLRFVNGIVDPLMVCECILFLVLLYLLVHIALGVKNAGCKAYLKNPWNLFEILTTLLVMVVIGLYIGCVIEATNIFRDFLSNTSSFTNFETVSDIHVVMKHVQAWLLFLLMFKVVKQVRFFRFLYMYEKTLSEAITKLLGAGFIFAILFLVHAMFAYLLYGAFVGGFENYWTTLITLIGMIRGTFDFWPMFEYEPVFTHVFFYSYYCTVYGITIGLIVAILSDSYKTVRSQLYYKASMDMQDHEMVDFMLKRFKLWAGFSKPKPGFRRVHFQGEPSISSRCTSSYSNRSTGNDSVTSSDGLSSLMEPPVNAVGRLSSTWEDVLNTMDRVSRLDKIEEDLLKKTQKGIDEWKWQNRIQSLEKERQGLLSWSDKPPTGRAKISSKIPHTTFKERRSTVTANSEGGASKTPPTNTAGAEKSTRGRPLSDQGGRFQPPKPKERMSVYNFFKSLKPSKPAW